DDDSGLSRHCEVSLWGRPDGQRKCVGRNVGTPPSGVRARGIELPEQMLIGIERRLRDFHDARPIGPQNRGPDGPAWKYAAEAPPVCSKVREGRIRHGVARNV